MNGKVAVIGCGNGGVAIAAYLASIGVKVRMSDPFPQYLGELKAAGELTLTLEGKTSTHKLELVTDSIAEAIEGVELIMVVTPSDSHKIIAEKCSGALIDGQIVVLNPGRTGGAVEFMTVIRNNGCTADVTVAEAQTLIYSCRKNGPTGSEIYGVKNKLTLGAFPASRTQKVLEVLNPVYPQFVPAKNCLETSLGNIGAMFHPAPFMMNLARVESDKTGFLYYWDGISPSVAKLVEEMDKERISVAEAYGVKVLSACEWMAQSYGTAGDNLYEHIQNNAAYGDIKAPTYINARYITEDVPMSIVPISEFGRIASVPTPNIDSVIQLTSTIYARDFRTEGRNAKKLGLEGMNKEQIACYFETGKI